MSRLLKQLAKQITRSAWKKLRDTKKLAKSETANILTSFTEEYHAQVEDRTHGTVPVVQVVKLISDTFDYLSLRGTIVADALHAYSLNTIVLYAGDEMHEGCYAGGMADYEVDECRLYIAAGRALENISPEITLGAHNVGTDFRTTLSHEMGHLVMQAVEDAIGMKFRIIYDEHDQNYWSANVSEYGATDDHELFAEAFAAWTSPYYTGGLPQVLVDMFEKAGIARGVKKLAKAKKESADIVLADGTVISGGKIDEILEAVEDADWFSVEGTISPELLQAFKDAGYDELTQAGVSTESDMREMVSQEAEKYAEEHAADLVVGLEDTTRDSLRGTIEDAVKEGWDLPELAEEIDNNFAFGEYRSKLIAKNEIALAYSRGRRTAAEKAGATRKISLLSSDHDDNEDCSCSAAADAGQVDFDESFVEGDEDYMFAPYHVNCIFAGNTFAPYGELQQMVRAWYEGPSIEISAGGKQLSVGPNHPILTSRGFVKAALLRKGDQILYDHSTESQSFEKSDLVKIPTVEDAFFTLQFHSFGNASVPSAANYFHGDEKFIKSEIDVIHPARRLLPILDTSGIEHLGKCSLIDSDMSAAHVASCSSCHLALQRVFSTTTSDVSFLSERRAFFIGRSNVSTFLTSDDGVVSSVSGGSYLHPLFFSGLSVPLFSAIRHILSSSIALFDRFPSRTKRFTSFRIDNIHIGTYRGYCYDASTQHGLYAANGFVASNCQCDWVAIYPGDENDDNTEEDYSDGEGDEGDDEEHGKFAKGGPGSGPHPGMGPKPSETKKATIKGKLHDLLDSGHPFTTAELVKATGETAAKIENAMNYMMSEKGTYYQKQGLQIVKDAEGNYTVVKASLSSPMTGAAKEPAATVKEPAASTASAAAPIESAKETGAPKIMTTVEADTAYKASLKTALMKLGESDGTKADLKAFKDAKAQAMADWKTNTTGVKTEPSPVHGVFAADANLYTNLGKMSHEDALAQWKKDTADEKAGKSVLTGAAKEVTANPIIAPVGKPEGPIKIVPEGFKQLDASDFKENGGKFAKGMAGLKSDLRETSESSEVNKATVQSKLAAELKDSPNFQALKAAAGDYPGKHQQGTVESRLVAQWASSSGDNNPTSVAMQLAVRDAFNVDEKDITTKALTHLSAGEDKVYANAAAQLTGSAQNGPLMKAALQEYVQGMYRVTQADLASRGISEVYAMRGMNTGTSKGTNSFGKLTLQPASSFSADVNTARSFMNGGHLYLAKVPASQVLSTYMTGFGCTNEHEVVVIASNNMRAFKMSQNDAHFGDSPKALAGRVFSLLSVSTGDST